MRILLFIALPLSIVIAVVIVLTTSGGSPTATSADGRTVSIEKITFGTHHRFVQGKWWVRLLRPIRGNRWAAQRGCYETRFTNNWPALMVWTRWEGINHSNGVAVEATLLDENGTESELALNKWNAVPGVFTGGSQSARVAWLFNNFPRRTDTLRLRIYDRDKRYVPTQAVELAFSNPARRRFMEWRASDMPVHVSSNRTEFILSSVQQGSNALWRLNFVVRTNGTLDSSWRVGGITASSASGNVLSTRSNLAAAPVTNLTFQLRGALWPEEPVWRFAVEFFRATGFEPNELWALTNVAIPARASPLQFTTNLVSYRNHPIKFNLESAPQNTPWRRGDIRRNANVSVEFEAGDAQLFLIAARDDQSREVRTEVFPGIPRHVYLFGLEIPQGAQSVNLTFGIRRAVVVKFDVAARSVTRLRRE
jgi:hypothetical protein